MYFYTITKDGQEYRAIAPHYHWKLVLAYFGVEREEIRRGALAGQPLWESREPEPILPIPRDRELDICKSCGRVIIWDKMQKWWDHEGEPKPRHPGVPSQEWSKR